VRATLKNDKDKTTERKRAGARQPQESFTNREKTAQSIRRDRERGAIHYCQPIASFYSGLYRGQCYCLRCFLDYGQEDNEHQHRRR